MAGVTQSGANANINVVPLIDIVLVLLIIFMVVTPMLLAGFNADPPKAINLRDHPEDADNDHVLGLDKDGRYYFDKKLIAAEAIGPKLDSIFGAPGRTDFVLYLRADGKLPYSKVQDAMEFAMKNKVHVIGLVGEQTPGTTSTVKGDTRATTPGGN